MTPENRHPDRRNPLVLDIQVLGRRAGTMRTHTTMVPAPADLGVDMIGVPEGSDLALDLRLEAVVEGVLVSGTVAAQLRGECARCLTKLADEAEFDLQELYFYPGNEVSEEESLVIDETIDLDEALRDAVVLDLPFTPLCREDCLGLCPVCGFNLNDDPTHGHEAATDPRWSQLQSLDLDRDN